MLEPIKLIFWYHIVQSDTTRAAVSKNFNAFLMRFVEFHSLTTFTSLICITIYRSFRIKRTYNELNTFLHAYIFRINNWRLKFWILSAFHRTKNALRTHCMEIRESMSDVKYLTHSNIFYLRQNFSLHGIISLCSVKQGFMN
jgi:hypothetical protein